MRATLFIVNTVCNTGTIKGTCVLAERALNRSLLYHVFVRNIQRSKQSAKFCISTAEILLAKKLKDVGLLLCDLITLQKHQTFLVLEANLCHNCLIGLYFTFTFTLVPIALLDDCLAESYFSLFGSFICNYRFLSSSQSIKTSRR